MSIYKDRAALQVRGQTVTSIQDAVCIEDTFRLYLNDLPLARIIASPDQLAELGAGFVVCEGLARQIRDVHVSGNDIQVYAETTAQIDYELCSSGCVGVRGMPRTVEAELVIDQSQVFHIIRQIESDVWRKTGGVHCSVLAQDGEVISRSSDVGRHSTVDKVVGFALLNHIDLGKCVLGCTGRQPAGMISKVANAGISIVVSKAASTDSGILLAEQSGVTLVCFARGDRFTVYAHPERIAGIVPTMGPQSITSSRSPA